MTKKKTIKSKTEVRVPIKWHVSDQIIPRFTTNMVVQKLENDFKISFFEINPDIVLEPNKPPAEVNAYCVASVIVTADRLPGFIKALETQLDSSTKKSRLK